jgi:capsular polysaccharide biosynthesis protein
MEESIDLRPYLAALGRYFWLIGGAVILAIAISVGVYLSSDNYTAIALLTVPDPAQEFQFDPRIITNVRSTPLLTAYPELAKSNEVLSGLLDEARTITDGRISTLSQLRAMLVVTSSADGRLLRLMASDKDPQAASELANAWANEFAAMVQAVYGRGGIEYYSEQLSQANDQLRLADEALVAFQTTNRQGIVDNELAALLQRQQALLADESNYQRVLADIQALRTQLENNSTEAVTLSEQLAMLTVQLRAFEKTLATPTAPMFELNVGADAQLTAGERAAALQQLEALRVSVDSALAATRAELDTLAAPIFALQTEKQQLFGEGERLLKGREVAQETYLTITRKIDEERVAARETLARVASPALVPEEPARPNLLVMASLFAVAALLPAVALIVFLTWWRGARQTS